ncbi:hypothetical protein [Sphaerisporangium fuscum]|uniref:hypothetical protein n=1 Tax=Sphaerisporangium fuscum TaxID=2835868 RepID=UPI001BDBF01E|nr:hypothetical protein [Sphaerisporangium fuscum]
MSALSARARAHRAFLVVLGLGALLRVAAMLGYRPALWFPDSYTYVVTAMRPRPDLVRPAGYSLFLRLLEPFHNFGLVVFVQHLLGLAIGVLVYLAARRWRCPTWAAVAASAPVLLDGYQIELEHLLVSDTLFAFLVAAALLTGMRPLTWRTACATGLLLACATVTRTVGLPLIGIVAVSLVARHALAARTRRSSATGTAPAPVPGTRPPVGGAHSPGIPATGTGRAARRFAAAADRLGLRLVGVLLVAALLPVAGYAAWFGATNHRFGIVGSNGVFLYSRTMAFADCAIMRPPRDLAVLCDSRTPSRRPPSQEYIWAPDSPIVALPGITFTEETDRLGQRFAVLALRSQPLDYAASVLSELGRTFTWGRPVYPDQEIYQYYEFPATPPPPPGRYPATAGAEFAQRYEQGPIGTRIVEPFAGVTRAYQHAVRLPGTVLLVLLLLPPAVALVRARRARGGQAGAARPTGVPWGLPWLAAVALLVVPPATAEFDYRYVLPAVPLACLAAALVASRRL